jgi:hypothetical protein
MAGHRPTASGHIRIAKAKVARIYSRAVWRFSKSA